MSIVAVSKWLSQASGWCPPLYYHPLDPNSHEIRLLTSIRVNAKDRLECKLMTVPLHSCPSFTALSYVWGDNTDRVPIRVNGQTFQATKSLASALRYIPRHWKSKYPGRNETELWAWADAVCINQSDSNEKSCQVSLMKEIFSGAEVVMCWMPSASTPWYDDIVCNDDRRDGYLRTAFETFEFISKELRCIEEHTGKTVLEMDQGDERLIRWLEKCPKLRNCSTGGEWPHWLNMNWFAVDYFCQLQYWRRVWILEEMALARDPLLFCKSGSLSFPDTFNRAMAWFDVLAHGQLPAPSFLPAGLWHSLTTGDGLKYDLVSGHWQAWMCQHMNGYTASWFTAFNALDLTATEPKDYVYGILGVMGIDIEVDYSERTSVAKALHDMIGVWLKRYQKFGGEDPAAPELRNPELHFLPWAGLGRDCSRAECQGFASWAPSPPHSKHGISHTLFFGKVNADFGVFSNNALTTASVQASSLFVTGLVIDSVHELYPNIRAFSDLCPFILGLLSDSQNGRPDPAARRRLLRDLFELLCGEDITHSIWITRLDLSSPPAHDYIAYACAFVLGVLSRGRDYGAMLENLGLRSDSEEGFVQSLLETFLDLNHGGSGRPGNAATSRWLQDLLDFESTRQLPRDSKVAQACQEMGIGSSRATRAGLGSGVIFQTSGGCFGFGSRQTAVGDLACVLKGYRSNALLRNKGHHFLYVGEGKVHGMVHGEAAELVKNGKSRVMEFELR